VKTYSLYRLKILSYMDGRHVFAQYGPIERRPIVTSRFTEGCKRTEQKETKDISTEVSEGSKGDIRKVPIAVVQPAAVCGSLFSLHLLFPHAYALDRSISNVSRGHLNFVTFANFCSSSFAVFLLCALL
jgi:hypothetical protein